MPANAMRMTMMATVTSVSVRVMPDRGREGAAWSDAVWHPCASRILCDADRDMDYPPQAEPSMRVPSGGRETYLSLSYPNPCLTRSGGRPFMCAKTDSDDP